MKLYFARFLMQVIIPMFPKLLNYSYVHNLLFKASNIRFLAGDYND